MIPVRTLDDGAEMPLLGMGTWQMGGRSERDPSDTGEKAETALRTGLRLGFTHIDTAEMYADGFAEEITGRAIQGFSREKLFLVSKVWKTHLHYDDVLSAAERTLKRLGTDYLDLYLIHQADPATPLRETMRAMNRLVDEKIVRHLGVSNFSKEHLVGAQVFADSRIEVDQVHFNLKIREAEVSGLAGWCRANQVLLEAWRPLQKGSIVSQKFLLKFAEKYGVTPGVIALAWVLNHPDTAAIVKSMDAGHLNDNLHAAELKLSPEDFEELSRSFPEQSGVSDAVPLF